MGRLQESAASAGAQGPSPAPPPPQLLVVIAAMLRELRGGDVPPVALDDDLERTLGIDSLGRMELMLRLEKAFSVRMPEALVQQAQTPRDLLRALAAAAPRQAADFGLRTAAGAEVPSPDGLALPHHAGTLIEVLQWHADRADDRVHITLLGDDAPVGRLTLAGLLERARAVAAGLQRSGLAPGESVALMLPTSLAFFEAFTGILLAGGFWRRALMGSWRKKLG